MVAHDDSSGGLRIGRWRWQSQRAKGRRGDRKGKISKASHLGANWIRGRRPSRDGVRQLDRQMQREALANSNPVVEDWAALPPQHQKRHHQTRDKLKWRGTHREGLELSRDRTVVARQPSRPRLFSHNGKKKEGPNPAGGGETAD